jgi:hypothetical protein
MDHLTKQQWSRVVPYLLDGMVFKYVIWFNFIATNNDAEYETLIVDLPLANELRA